MPSEQLLNRATLRPLLRVVLPSPSDFEAFCVDCFPNVAARFASGMDRVTKFSS